MHMNIYKIQNQFSVKGTREFQTHFLILFLNFTLNSIHGHTICIISNIYNTKSIKKLDRNNEFL